MKSRDLPPVHPGEILLEDFLNPMGITLVLLSSGLTRSPSSRLHILATL